jgi:hypothetical protein
VREECTEGILFSIQMFSAAAVMQVLAPMHALLQIPCNIFTRACCAWLTYFSQTTSHAAAAAHRRLQCGYSLLCARYQRKTMSRLAQYTGALHKLKCIYMFSNSCLWTITYSCVSVRDESSKHANQTPSSTLGLMPRWWDTLHFRSSRDKAVRI